MAKTIKKSQLHESIRRYIKEKLHREEEEMQDAPEMGDMPSEPMNPRLEFKKGVEDLRKLVDEEFTDNQKLLNALTKLDQQFDNLYPPKEVKDLKKDGGKEIGM